MKNARKGDSQISFPTVVQSLTPILALILILTLILAPVLVLIRTLVRLSIQAQIRALTLTRAFYTVYAGHRGLSTY
jgi:hypothetical protein